MPPAFPPRTDDGVSCEASEKHPFRIVRKEKLDLVVDATTIMGHLRVTTVPGSASIKIDGKQLATGAWEGEVEVGAHLIEVNDDGYGKAMRSVTIVRGQALVQEIPLATQVNGGPDYRGVYARFTLLFALSPTTTHYEPPAGSGVTSDTNAAIAGGAALRIGYNFDIVGVEFVTSFLADYHNEHLHYPGMTIGDPELATNEPSGFFGIGPRVTSKDSTVRFTFGVAPGLVVRNVNLSRKPSVYNSATDFLSSVSAQNA